MLSRRLRHKRLCEFETVFPGRVLPHLHTVLYRLGVKIQISWGSG